MNKQESQVLKGIAILMMIYLHAAVSDFWHLIRACDPVPFFLIISGYGLSLPNDNSLRRRLSRCLRLLNRYWVVLTVFLLVGLNVNPSAYFNNVLEVVFNYSTWQTSYNGECWFVFPYLCLLLISPYLESIIEKRNPIHVILISLILYIGTLFCLKLWGTTIIYDNQLLFHIVRFIQFLLPFSLGSFAFSHQWFQWLSSKLRYQWLNLILLTIIVFFRCQISFNYLDSFYAFGVISLYLSLRRYTLLDSALLFLGRHSTNIWFVHSWFCFYLFREQFYSLGHPVLIYLSLVIASLLVSIILDKIQKITLAGFTNLLALLKSLH